MTAQRVYLSTTIPYVNSRAHVGHALELVQADVLARHHRRIGDEVRLQSGTDDNSLKNVLAAAAEGISTQGAGQPQRQRVRRAARAPVAQLRRLHPDQQRPAPPAGRRAALAGLRGQRRPVPQDLRGPVLRGLRAVLHRRRARRTGTAPTTARRRKLVAEENWFFRLSKYADRLHDGDQLRQAADRAGQPPQRGARLHRRRAGGFQRVPVGGEGTRLGHRGTRRPEPGDLRLVGRARQLHHVAELRFTGRAQRRVSALVGRRGPRTHVVGKGVLRFHAVYWPAILLSAGEPLPTEIFVHDYLTVDGRKISKSTAGGAAESRDPVALASTYGPDALRWWLLREVPRVGDTDFTVDKLVARANEDLANGLGNLVNRVVSLVHSYRNGAVRPCARPAGTSRWLAAAASPHGRGLTTGLHPTGPLTPPSCGRRSSGRPRRCARHWPGLTSGPPRRRSSRLSSRRIGTWRSPRRGTWPEPSGRATRRQARLLDQVLGALIAACQILAAEIWPFVPDLAARVAAACGDFGGTLPKPQPVFPRIET